SGWGVGGGGGCGRFGRLRPAVWRFSQSKCLIGREGRGPNPRKSAVVPTKSILTAANMPIIGGHHVLALQGPPEGWQATSLLERCPRIHGRWRARGAAARALSGLDQRHSGIGLAAINRSFGGWRRAAADTIAVSGRPCDDPSKPIHFGRSASTRAAPENASILATVRGSIPNAAPLPADSNLQSEPQNEPERKAHALHPPTL